MLADLGFMLLMFACLLSAYATAASIAAGRLKIRPLYASAKAAVYAMTALTFTASLILWFLLFQRDYTVAYIFKNSSNDLPAFYTVTAFWCSLEGSHTLWTLLLTIFASIALATSSEKNQHIMPWVIAALTAVSTWMLFMACSYSDPFARMLPPMPNGQGMNALLQNPYMAIHPPTLFTGYTTLSVPFAYAIAALCYGDITEGWLTTIRRWSLVAWTFLSAGVFLGGRWAYVELGWAGYWAWDPVENSSFIPWLLCTGLLHTLLIQEKMGHMKRASIVLAVLAFFMSFFGTFLTRSGIISSVHSFAESAIGPNYLGFLAVLILGFAVLYYLRADAILPADVEKAWGPSRETAVLIAVFLFCTFAAIVVIGTLFPILSEAVTGQKTSIQAPYFNAFAPWVGLFMIVVLAIGNIMRFQSAKIPDVGLVKRISLGFTVIGAPLFFHLGHVLETKNGFALGAQVVGIALAFWCGGCLVADLMVRFGQGLQWNSKLIFEKNRAYLGAFIAHIGVLVAILGFLGNYRGVHTDFTIKAGDSVKFEGFDLKFNGMTTAKAENATLFVAPIEIFEHGALVETLNPAKSRYPTKAEFLNEVGLYSRFWFDLYMVLADFDKHSGKTVTLQVHKNPTVRLVWISVVLFVVGGLVAMSDFGRGSQSKDTLYAPI
jgi:cytochrome c-type biogenesis protein CcmF